MLSLPDPRLGERICLAFTAEPGHKVDLSAVLAHLTAAGLSRYELPEFALPLDAMPLMANGKIDKPLLMRGIGAGELVPSVVP